MEQNSKRILSLSQYCSVAAYLIRQTCWVRISAGAQAAQTGLSRDISLSPGKFCGISQIFTRLFHSPFFRTHPSRIIYHSTLILGS